MYPAYIDDNVAKNSLIPTFAATAFFIDNAHWDGIPFLVRAGKALHIRCVHSPIITSSYNYIRHCSCRGYHSRKLDARDGLAGM